MAVEITGVPGTPLANKQTDTGNNVSAVGSKPNSSGVDIAAGSQPTADSFTVSQQAERLRVIESTVNAQPDIDDSRVESLKTAIDAGRYDIDPARVAEKLIALESQFVA
jgi:negative regulator of flagellin synthesis FlgM